MTKNFAGESFTVALISGTENVWIRGVGGLSRISVEVFLSSSAKNLASEPFCAVFQ